MPTSLQRCPSCKLVGRIHRSKSRNKREQMLGVLAPVYGVYRCHGCNWRGWMARSRSSNVLRYGLLLVYVTVALLIAFGIYKWAESNLGYKKYDYNATQ